MLKTKIKHTEPFYSYHAFLFPFEWQYREADARATLEEKTKLGALHDLMQRSGGHWERRSSWLKPTSTVQYNEANYFYDFVRPVLYDTGKKDSLQAHYYNKIPQSPTEYIIQLKSGKVYRLDVDDIVVSFYSSGVGVLAFHLYNRRQEQSAPEDILAINQFGRRLYPPFLKAPTEHLGEQTFFEYNNWKEALEAPQFQELAREIRLEVNSKVWITEDFHQWKQQPDLKKEPGLISQLLPKAIINEMHLSPVLDDRMFVLCWYGNDWLAHQLKTKHPSDSWWYKYIFVDFDTLSCQNDELLKEQLKHQSYTRWTNFKTYYGASRYSLVCLTETFTKNGFTRVLCSHMQTMYYKIALLCLVQRACLMRFSGEVTWISQMAVKDRLLARKVSSLYKQYLRFINKIYFREVTAQEQGIELYDMLQQSMRLAEHVKDLEGEIEELHNYVSMLEEEKRADQLDILTYIGAFFVVPSFIATFLALEGENNFSLDENLYSLGGLMLVSAVLAFAIIRSRGGWRMFFLLLFGLLMFFLTFIYPQIAN